MAPKCLYFSVLSYIVSHVILYINMDTF